MGYDQETVAHSIAERSRDDAQQRADARAAAALAAVEAERDTALAELARYKDRRDEEGVVSLKSEPGYHAQRVWALRFEGQLTAEVIDLARHVLSVRGIRPGQGYLLLNREDAKDLAAICQQILGVEPTEIAYRPLLKYQGFNLLGHPELQRGKMLFWELAAFPRVPE